MIFPRNRSWGLLAGHDDQRRNAYDATLLKRGIHGKYAQRYTAGIHIVRLAPDAAAAFPTDQAVKEALRLLLKEGTRAAILISPCSRWAILVTTSPSSQ
jgi:hypothetical protein